MKLHSLAAPVAVVWAMATSAIAYKTACFKDTCVPIRQPYRVIEKKIRTIPYDAPSLLQDLKRAVGNDFVDKTYRFFFYGAVNAGKSSFICHLLNRKPSDPACPSVAETECTRTTTCYNYNSTNTGGISVQLCDTPGYDTPLFQLDMVDISRAQGVVFMLSGPPRVADVAMFRRIKAAGKNVYVVRSQADTAIDNAWHDSLKDSKETVEDLRKEVAGGLKTARDAVYVVSTRREIESSKLERTLMSSVDEDFDRLTCEKLAQAIQQVTASRRALAQSTLNGFVAAHGATNFFTHMIPFYSLWGVGVDWSLALSTYSAAFQAMVSALGLDGGMRPYMSSRSSAWFDIAVDSSVSTATAVIAQSIGASTILDFVPIIGPLAGASLSVTLMIATTSEWVDSGADAVMSALIGYASQV